MSKKNTIQTGKLTRYQVRNTLFRIRDKRVEDEILADIVWEVVRKQLKPGENIENFTFIWDVHPNTPTKVIRRKDWDKEKKEKYPKEWDKQQKVEEDITLFTGQK